MQGQVIYIYKIINKINGKIYFGQTINPSERWSRHKTRGKSPKYIRHPLYCSMKKYGLENFNFEILENHLTSEQADKAETQYIEYFKTINREFGYNIEKGGQKNRSSSLKGIKRGPMSEETKQKVSISKRSQKLIAWNKGLPNPQKGKVKFTEQQQKEICELYKTLTSRELAIKFDCSPTTIIKILRINNVSIQ